MTSHRSAITGEFVTADHAKTNPDTTVSESPCAECERLRAVVHTQGVAIDGYREEVERLRAEQPIVRTVGDLTPRHIGRRVRLEGAEVVEGELVRIEFRPSRVAMTVVKPDGSRKYPRTGIDSPCEVLP